MCLSSPDATETDPRSRRRQFSAEYKLRILRLAEACERPGEVGALLRREGLYFSHLTNWRNAREKGELAGLEPRKRGRKPKHSDPKDRVIGELKRENARLRTRAERAEKLIEMQKRTRALIGEPAKHEQRELLVELVREAAKDVGVRTACDVFGVSRASFYRWADGQPSGESDRNVGRSEMRTRADDTTGSHPTAPVLARQSCVEDGVAEARGRRDGTTDTRSGSSISTHTTPSSGPSHR